MSEWERGGRPCLSAHVSVKRGHSFPLELSNLKRLKKPRREHRFIPALTFLYGSVLYNKSLGESRKES